MKGYEMRLNSAAIRVAVRDHSRMTTELLSAALARVPNFEVLGIDDLAELTAPAAQILLISAGTQLNSSTQPRKSELAHQLSIIHPDTKAILLVEKSTRELVIEAFRCGVRGVFSRNQPFESLLKCITSVHSGQVWASQTEIQFLLEALSEPMPMPLVDAKGKSLLSQREQSIVHCVAEGLTNREIAVKLKLSEHTVKNYLFRIFDKLGVSSRVELIIYTVSQLMPAKVVPTVKNWGNHDPSGLATWSEQMEPSQFPPHLLAELYREGRIVRSDKVTALMWLMVAEVLAGEMQGQAKVSMHQLSAAIPPEQISEARCRAAKWLSRRAECSTGRCI